MNTRLVVQGAVVALVGVVIFLSSRWLAERAGPQSWPEPFGRRLDGPNPLRDFTWGYRAAGLGACVLGFVWLGQGLR